MLPGITYEWYTFKQIELGMKFQYNLVGGAPQYFHANQVYELKKLPLEFAQFQKERENTNGRFQTFETSTGATKCSFEPSKLPEWLLSNKLANVGTQVGFDSMFVRWPILF